MGEVPAPAGWYPDPSGRAGKRYWTGTSWHTLPPDHKMSRGAKVGLSVGAVVTVLLVGFGVRAVYAGPHEYSSDEYRSGVIDTCQGAVKKDLKDPESARFDSWAVTELAAGSQGQRHFSASGFVNAKNGFGGYSGNTTYRCTATVSSDGTISAQAGPK